MNDNNKSLGNAIATAIVAALLGLLLIGNAKTAPQPLQAIDIVAGVIFLGAAFYTAIKGE